MFTSEHFIWIGLCAAFLIGFTMGSVKGKWSLKNAGLVNKTLDGVKVLAHGDITKKFTVKVNAYSDAAKAKIEAAGGKAEVI